MNSLQKLHDFYDFKKGAQIVQQEFGFYSMDKWKQDGHIKENDDINALFGFDKPAKLTLGGLGCCEAAFSPVFDEVVLEDRGEHELVRDFAGRSVLCFKGRRSGFMPEYVDHPVKDFYTWEKDVKWRMDPHHPERLKVLEHRAEEAILAQNQQMIICQNMVGGYMYLRSLIGPEELLYMFYDNAPLIRSCMQSWFELADGVTEYFQQHVSLDEVFPSEDICYNHGSLISPCMIEEFLFPYYQQLLTNIKRRNRDKKFHLQIDTDGDCRPVIDVYAKIGMDYMSPFEVASGCDVVEIRKQYPWLLMRGGFDKRILAAGKEQIDREIERIMPFMKEQGGYIPTCDHGVPAEVPFENYMYYREKMKQF